MTDVFSKINDNTIQVIKPEVTEMVEHTYKYEYLIKQKATIETQKAKEMAQRDEEIAFVDALLAECVKLGITAEPEPIEEPIK